MMKSSALCYFSNFRGALRKSGPWKRPLAFFWAMGILAGGAGAAWESGKQIPVGNPERLGRLAKGMSTMVPGAVDARSPLGAGIFTMSAKHSQHPGLFFHPLLKRTPEGVPVVGAPVEIGQPNGKGKVPPDGTIFQTGDGTVHAFWIEKNEIRRTVLDRNGKKFVDSPAGPLKVKGLPRPPSWLGVVKADGGAIDLVIGSRDGTSGRPTDGPDWRDPAYRPFDGAGVYRGGFPFTFLHTVRLSGVDGAPEGPARQASATLQEAIRTYGGITQVDLGAGRERDVLTGSWFGNLYYYANKDARGMALEPYRLVAGEDGNAVFHPSVGPFPVAYPHPETGRLSDLVAGGEGAVYYYRFTGKFHKNGAPIYAKPVPVLEKDADLYTGSLPVLSTVDWDGDGALDIVAGNSEGRLLWFRNLGSNAEPAFDDSEEIRAGGRPVHILPGYADVQGPFEARWGYLSPGAVDWNGDGLPDIVTSGATARHEVLLNTGTRNAPKLEPPQTIHCRGLDLHGTWRVKPGVAQAGNRVAYVALDDQDEFHLYWRIDDFNVEDGGKLRLEDGSAIRANFLSAGGTGRAKITVVDWDRDGKLDLVVGTPRHGSIPNPEKGLPQSLGLKGAAVVFLKNVGTNEKMVFAQPTLMRFRGTPIYLGQHECGPAIWDVGQPDGPDLLVGHQDGRIRFYARGDLAWDPQGN